MATIKVNKIEAARRQIDAAIRLLFDNEDPIAIHTLIMAGFRILRDIAEKQNSNISKVTQSFIKSEHSQTFLNMLTRIQTA